MAEVKVFSRSLEMDPSCFLIFTFLLPIHGASSSFLLSVTHLWELTLVPVFIPFFACLSLVWFSVLTHHENDFFKVIGLLIINLEPHIQLLKSHVPGQCFCLESISSVGFPSFMFC